jgi:flavin reductase (DIM6/NTAB) family NADH-FMN oxidoreductase RutF
MYIVTCIHGEELSGCLVGFATQCGIQPPRFLVCVSIENHTYKVASRASSLVVHLITDKDRGIASLFGEQTGDDVDKFAAISWRPGTLGGPILSDCEVFFEGRILATVPFGDHVGFVLAPIDESEVPVSLDGAPLTLHDVESFNAGHPVPE